MMKKRAYNRLSKSTAKLWLTAGGLLGAGMLPCPDCGTPMIFHVWPLVGFVLVARAIRKRFQTIEPADVNVVPQNSRGDALAASQNPPKAQEIKNALTFLKRQVPA